MNIRIILLLTLNVTTLATPVAIIDSGLDYRHKNFVDAIWTNDHEVADNNRDDDLNGYVDDVMGWNFASNNNKIFDPSLEKTFSKTPQKFFDIQQKVIQGTATEEERAWLKDLRNNKEAIKEIQKFGNYVHGTHVAGIANQFNKTTLMGIKLIPTEINISQIKKSIGNQNLTDNAVSAFLLKKLLATLADQSLNMLIEIAQFTGDHQMRVANGSFGSSFNQLKLIVAALYKVTHFKDASEEDLAKYTIFMLEKMVNKAGEMVSRAPNTLFVFAAGNDGTNNDEKPISPGSVRAKNSLTVAATLGRTNLASFSNYGQSVDVAAPGVAIFSSIPGDQTMALSGTSQAAPQVAALASLILSINPSLSPKKVKDIIMMTVDKKEYLKNKVNTSGIINTKRAKKASELSLDMDVSKAIQIARSEVADERELNTLDWYNAQNASIVELPSLFNLKK